MASMGRLHRLPLEGRTVVCPEVEELVGFQILTQEAIASVAETELS